MKSTQSNYFRNFTNLRFTVLSAKLKPPLTKKQNEVYCHETNVLPAAVPPQCTPNSKVFRPDSES
jgi:hypothetical protein